MRLEESAERDSLLDYLRGVDDMELTYMSLHRAMRLAEGLMKSPLTRVRNSQLPSLAERDTLRSMRNAIEHNNQPIIDGLAGKGQTLALFVREGDATIDTSVASAPCGAPAHAVTQCPAFGRGACV